MIQFLIWLKALQTPETKNQLHYRLITLFCWTKSLYITQHNELFSKTYGKGMGTTSEWKSINKTLKKNKEWLSFWNVRRGEKLMYFLRYLLKNSRIYRQKSFKGKKHLTPEIVINKFLNLACLIRNHCHNSDHFAWSIDISQQA